MLSALAIIAAAGALAVAASYILWTASRQSGPRLIIAALVLTIAVLACAVLIAYLILRGGRVL
jgi:hypothetical protein